MNSRTKRLPAETMKEKIAGVATDLLIRNGLHGTSYDMIAKAVGTTTTNIHYHFGSKNKLVSEIIASYVATASQRHSDIWRNRDLSLFQKIKAVKELNRRRHARFNTVRTGSLPWSLIGRMRLESHALPKEALASLNAFSVTLRDDIALAVNLAADRSELKPGVSSQDVAVMLTGIVYSSAVFTQMAGSFEGVEEMYDAFWSVVGNRVGAEEGGQRA